MNKKIITLRNFFSYRFREYPIIKREQFLDAILPERKKIIIRAWADFNNGKVVKKNNFGDDLNIWLLYSLSGAKVLNHKYLAQNKPFVLPIGSIINMACKNNAIIWGSGVMYPDEPLKERPLKVLAVRGKLTREYLLKHNIDCPEVYGDPALLLPLVYKPKIIKKFKYGIIAHWKDEQDNEYGDLQKILPSVKLISLTNYKNWKGVIKEFLECECILSSSLHGLIISDAYKIPNLWIEFSKPVGGNRFKFFDYYSSVNKVITGPLKIDNTIKLESIEKLLEDYKYIKIDLLPLLQAAPFKVLKKYLNMF